LLVSDAKWLWHDWITQTTRVYGYDEKPATRYLTTRIAQ
jgi:hypothetical protein